MSISLHTRKQTYYALQHGDVYLVTTDREVCDATASYRPETRLLSLSTFLLFFPVNFQLTV